MSTYDSTEEARLWLPDQYLLKMKAEMVEWLEKHLAVGK
jgi:hypothetical protein